MRAYGSRKAVDLAIFSTAFPIPRGTFGVSMQGPALSIERARKKLTQQAVPRALKCTGRLLIA